MGPQLFNQFCKRQNDVSVDFNKSEAFSIGLVLLESGLLVSIQDCFNRDKKKFDEWMLQLYLNQFFKRYEQDEVLEYAIRMLLEVDEQRRQDPRQLRDKILEMN